MTAASGENMHKESSEIPPNIAQPYFYLLRVHTPSSSRVLIPISPESSLDSSLHKRVIIEFPTIYVLSNPPDKLPNGLMLEEDFLGHSEKESKELEALLAEAKVQREDLSDGEVDEPGEGIQPDHIRIDKKVTDVLEQDLKFVRQLL